LLITAGATRNPIDAMRVLTARSTGSTGIELAGRFAESHRVHLLGSAEALLRAQQFPALTKISMEEYGSTRDLGDRMERWIRSNPSGVVIHAAAVGDYELDADPSAPPNKIPSGQAKLTLTLRPTPKLLDQLHSWSNSLRVVSFKAAAPGTSELDLEAIARRQLVRSGSELVFANVLGALGDLVLLVGPDHCERFTERNAAIGRLVECLMSEPGAATTRC
jgi:phosphopantothenoylcysteine synthetase/decarboxylase